ncbi:hypothetical protein LBMAG21_14370 [Armatimonadota bacterium]|nr:hypothetical protein LBMAG21_14370 [Armatimonadota bacterium]
MSTIDINNSPDEAWEWLIANLPEETTTFLASAYMLAKKYHQGKTRFCKPQVEPPPYVVHPLRVARILAEEWKYTEVNALATAILHDAFDGTLITERADAENELRGIMGSEIFEAVHLLTKPYLPTTHLSDIKFERNARYFKVLFEAPRWIRVVKLADRMDNLRDACQWGELDTWERYSQDSIGWHLYLARNTSPVAEVALFKALVDGERLLRGRAPVWADGRLIDPKTANLIPEKIAREYGIVGMVLQEDILVVGVRRRTSLNHQDSVKEALLNLENTPFSQLHLLGISEEALQDAHFARLFGS